MNEEKFKEWRDLYNLLKSMKSQEMKMRKELCVDIFKGSTAGNKAKFEIGSILVKAENKINFKLDTESVKAMYDELEEADKDAMKWSPSLKLREYKKLGEGSLLHECVTIKPAAPVLKVIDL